MMRKSSPKEDEQFSIIPNPIIDKATLEVKLNDNKNNKITIKIHDIYGSLVLTPVNNKTVKSGFNTIIDQSNLTNDSIYFVSFYVNGELRSQKKIITKSK